MITLKSYIHNILINEDKKDKKVIERGDINPAIGFENMKIVANVKKKYP